MLWTPDITLLTGCYPSSCDISGLEAHKAEIVFIGRFTKPLDLAFAQLEAVAIGDRIGYPMDQAVGRAAGVQKVGKDETGRDSLGHNGHRFSLTLSDADMAVFHQPGEADFCALNAMISACSAMTFSSRPRVLTALKAQKSASPG